MIPSQTAHTVPLPRLAWIVLGSLFLAACSGSGNINRIPGDRISVLAFEQTLQADPDLEDIRVSLPQPWTNQNWPQQGGVPTHALYHLALGDNPTRVWRREIGRGSDTYERLVATPVVANETVYTIDIRGRVKAFEATSGRELWEASLRHREERSRVGFGGSIAYADGRLYATTGWGFLHALDAQTGEELWSVEVDVPVRGGLTVADGRAFVVTQDNQLFAYDAESGDYLWEHVGIVENAGVLGAASPAVFEDTVVVAFSSGELIAFRTVNGQVTWQDALSRTGAFTALSTLNDIDGHPVIDRGRVYAASHSGRMVAIDLRTGERVWENNIGSIYTPWVGGNYIYAVTTDGEVVCINIRDGRLRWVTPLQRFEEPGDRKGLIRWSGPVLAGDRLLVNSSRGYMLSLSPYTGEVLSGMEIPDGTVIPPIVVNETVYILTEDGDLIAYR